MPPAKVVWVVAAAAMFLALTDPAPVPLPLALAMVAAAFITAAVITGVHTARRTSAVKGRSDVEGAITGNTFFAGSLLSALIVWRFAGELETGPTVTLAMVLLCTIFGLLTVAGLAVRFDRTALAFGVLLLLAAVGCLLVPYPGNVLVLGALGGGGMLVVAALARRR